MAAARCDGRVLFLEQAKHKRNVFHVRRDVHHQLGCLCKLGCAQVRDDRDLAFLRDFVQAMLQAPTTLPSLRALGRLPSKAPKRTCRGSRACRGRRSGSSAGRWGVVCVLVCGCARTHARTHAHTHTHTHTHAARNKHTRQHSNTQALARVPVCMCACARARACVRVLRVCVLVGACVWVCG